MCGFAFKLYAIVCVPLDTPTVLYLHHHRAASDGWNSDSLCDECSEEYRLLLQPFVGNCTSDRSCRCNVCLWQPLSLRNLASHTVFNLTFNLSSFTLTGKTLYHRYLYGLESNVVPNDRLVPLTFYRLTFYCLTCSFVRDRRCALNKRFHEDCVIPLERCWATSCTEHFATLGENIATLCEEQEYWWCDFCTRPLFKTQQMI